MADDGAGRDRIRNDLDATLFVEAGAGTGKTSELVHRIVHLVASGKAAITEHAGMTFTEAAAAELRERVRVALEDRVRDTEDRSEAERCSSALEVIDEAPLQTLHAFAMRVLTSHAIEAELPPGFALRDATAMGIAFDQRWGVFLDDLVRDPTADAVLRTSIKLGLRTEHLGLVARTLHDCWDLLAPVDPASTQFDDSPVDTAPMTGPLQAAIAVRHAKCRSDEDKMAIQLDKTGAALLAGLAKARTIEGQLETLAAGKLATKAGNQKWWFQALDECRRDVKAAEEARLALLDGIRQRLLGNLLGRVIAFTLEGAEERRRDGVLEYHDLLVRSRRLLESSPEVRASVASAYRFILVDEFQDSDPLQVELAALIARDERRAGHLFFVGDPKQSIYRFRRADITLYSRVRDTGGHDRVGLHTNHRSRPGVIDFVNATFGPWFAADEADGQAQWADLEAGVGASDGGGVVTLLGGEVEGGVDAAREVAAEQVAEAIDLALGQAWPVRDQTVEGGSRPPRPDDIAVLLPTRTFLPALERAFDARGLPYRVESKSLVWATQEVRDLLSIMRAVTDPGDEVVLVAALTSSAYACTWEELRQWREAGVVDGTAIADAFAHLASLAADEHSLTPAAMAERIIRERSMFEAAFALPRQRETWNRLRFVVEQARAFAEAGGSTLRGFVDWADRQAEEDAQALESVVPEPDDHAVRVLTIHAAKGLEFPIVFVAGLSVVRSRTDQARVLWGRDGRIEVRCGRRELGWMTPGYLALEQREDVLDEHEQARLMYVACTRARDHLVVDLHRATGSQGEKTNAARLAEWSTDSPVSAIGIDELRTLRPITSGRPEPMTPHRAPPGAVLAAGQELSDGAGHRKALREKSAVVRHTAASRLVVHDLPAGDAVAGEGTGTLFGSAVHGVLENAPLDPSWDGVDEAVLPVVLEAGLDPALGPAIAAAVRAALSCRAVAAAASGRCWREIFVATGVDGVLVEGFVDLMVEAADGLWIVDWKTDRVGDSDAVAAAAARYRPQIAAYALAAEAVADRPVVRATLVFCGNGVLREVDLEGDELAAAVGEVRERLSGAGARAEPAPSPTEAPPSPVG